MGWLDDKGLGDVTKSFLEHLEDLRKAILWSLVSLAVAMLIAVPLAPAVLAALKIPLRQAGKDPDQFLRVIQVTGGLSIATSVVLWTGILISAPFIIFFVSQFVFPGLTSREKRAVMRSAGFAVGLFALGVFVGYRMVLVVTLQWMLKINEWLGVSVDFVQISDYTSFVLKMLLAFGLAFEFPVVIVTLGTIGIISAAGLASKRRHVVVIILIVAAVITPTVDPVTQFLLSAPLYVLYEACIWIVRAMEKGRQR